MIYIVREEGVRKGVEVHLTKRAGEVHLAPTSTGTRTGAAGTGVTTGPTCGAGIGIGVTIFFTGFPMAPILQLPIPGIKVAIVFAKRGLKELRLPTVHTGAPDLGAPIRRFEHPVMGACE